MLNQCCQTFRECPQTFRGISPNIPGNAVKHSGECPIYFDGKGIVEASSITDVFFGELLIVCCVIFCVENLSKLLAARLNSGENLISMSWKSSEKFLLVSATQDSVSNHRRAIIFFFSMGVSSFNIRITITYLWLILIMSQSCTN